MTGMFTKLPTTENSPGGMIALVVWCLYFLPVGMLSYLHFKNEIK